MKILIPFLICICLSLFPGKSSDAQSLIPVPLKMEQAKGYYVFGDRESIALSDPALSNEARELQKILRQCVGGEAQIDVAKGSRKKAIYLELNEQIQSEEGYVLEVTPRKITIQGKTAAGVYYGIQTFRQLFLTAGGCTGQVRLAAIRVEDGPRYHYRALMLDPARHFIPLQDVKRYIDLMARYKFNTLQLHLTDDQGWRMEIKKYPRLTAVGAFRNKQGGDQGPDNGFYTQEQLKELIAYAASRHVEIVPELDIPGHVVAAIVSFPELGCRHMDSVPVNFGKTADRTLCASKEQVYRFYQDVLEEVFAVFPSRRVHLGGDEAVIDKNWGVCPDCQNFINEKGLDGIRGLMGYFFGRIYEIVKHNHRELMLWCELDNIRMPANEFLFNYPQDCTLFTWRMGLTPKTIELTGQAGIKLIASPGEHCYFDYPQYKGDLPEYKNWGMPLLTLDQAYNWDPGYGLPAERQEHIIGVAGLLWSEAIRDMNRITYMTYPRALALAEAGWSVMENRNWESFKRNLLPHLSALMGEGVSFRVPFEIY